MFVRSLGLVAVGAAALVPAVVSAQAAPPPPEALGKLPNGRALGRINFETNIGSFKLVSPGRTAADRAEGTMTISFTGSLLIVGLDGTVQPQGNLRREYFNQKHNRQVWFGTGTVTITGKMEAVQWFGRNMRGRWAGIGVFRFFGEFDANQRTGSWAYEGSSQRNPFFTSGVSIPIPPDPRFTPATPRRRGG